MARISQAWPPRDSVFNEQDAKIATLLCKLVLVMGPKNCPYYQHVKDHIPNVLEQPWSSDMSGTPKHVGMKSIPDLL